MTEKQALVLLICCILIWFGFALDLIIWKIKRSRDMEEKKKAEEEIKVGDEVKDLSTSNIGVVLSIGQQMIVYMTKLYHVYSNTRGSLEKTGRHFDEVGQLIDKLKGEDNE